MHWVTAPERTSTVPATFSCLYDTHVQFSVVTLPLSSNGACARTVACAAADCLIRQCRPATVTKLEWTSPLQIIKYPDPRLRAVNAKINVFDESLMRLAKEMIEIMYQ